MNYDTNTQQTNDEEPMDSNNVSNSNNDVYGKSSYVYVNNVLQCYTSCKYIKIKED